jgi:predicted translin family RNA/ssDNA-binding protein
MESLTRRSNLDNARDDTTKAEDAANVMRRNIEVYPAFAFSYTRLASW